MNNEYVKTAISLIIKILQNNDNPTREAIYELLEIQNGNKDVLIGHIEAIKSIMNKALEELQGSDSNENNNI